MIFKLYKFFFLDHKARLRAYCWIAFIAFVYGALSSIAFGRPEREVTWEVVELVGLLTLARAAWYVLQAQKPNSEPPHTANGWIASKLFRRPAWACAVIASSLLLITFLRIPSARIEAINADRTLSTRALISSTQPLRLQNQTAAKQVIAEAKSKSIELPERVVKRVGDSFIEAAKTDPEAWGVAVDFTSYRTTLSQNILASGTAQQLATTPVDAKLTSRYHFLVPKNYPEPEFTVGGDVPADRAAEAHFLYEGSPNAGALRGKQILLGEGGALGLDGMLLKHVVLRNTTVFYSGGPVYLEDFLLVNCTLVLTNVDATRSFALAVLASPRITFKEPATQASCTNRRPVANAYHVTGLAIKFRSPSLAVGNRVYPAAALSKSRLVQSRPRVMLKTAPPSLTNRPDSTCPECLPA